MDLRRNWSMRLHFHCHPSAELLCLDRFATHIAIYFSDFASRYIGSADGDHSHNTASQCILESNREAFASVKFVSMITYE